MSNQTESIEVSVDSGESFLFEVTPRDYKNFINNVSGRGKPTQQAHNFCVQTVVEKDKERLLALLSDQVGASMEIVSVIVDVYAPDIGAAAKKRKPSPKT